ncbi:MAG TPA: hypothetical protein VMF29_05815 [Candidatus Edwardsbacteria bacterium]|nr:hypothetical protein [Candidatus Edwardsbacteria bacterium]
MTALLLIAGCGPRRQVKATFLCRIDTGTLIPGSLTISPDRRHLMYAAADSGRQRVMVDGAAERRYDGILENSLSFSPDGKHHAYAAGRAKLRFVVLDGVDQSPYDGILHDTPVFGPDGKRLAYGALKDEAWTMVVDGRAGWVFDELWPPVFSPGGRHVAYIARTGPKMTVVLDTMPQRQFEMVERYSLAFESDSVLTYRAREQGRPVAVRNGMVTAAGAADTVKADSAAAATVVRADGKQHVVVNGRRGPGFDLVLPLGQRPVRFDGKGGFTYLALSHDSVFAVEERIR